MKTARNFWPILLLTTLLSAQAPLDLAKGKYIGTLPAGHADPSPSVSQFATSTYDSLGRLQPSIVRIQFGNSIPAGDVGASYHAMQTEGYNWSYRTAPGNSGMTCVSDSCTVPLDNGGNPQYIVANDLITVIDPVGTNCTGGASVKVSAATPSSITFYALGCGTTSYPLFSATFTKSYLKASTPGNILHSWLTITGHAAPGGTWLLADIDDWVTTAFNRGFKPYIDDHQMHTNDVRLGAKFADVLADEKTLLTHWHTKFPTMPILETCVNPMKSEDDGFVTISPIAVTSGAISAGTNTVHVADLPNTLYGGAGTPLVWTFPNYSGSFQLVLDTGGSSETVDITNMAGAAGGGFDITFTNANAHAVGFTFKPTLHTAVQVMTNEMHSLCKAVSDLAIPNVKVVDMQVEVYGTAAYPADAHILISDELHNGVDGKSLEGTVQAQALQSFPDYAPNARTGSSADSIYVVPGSGETGSSAPQKPQHGLSPFFRDIPAGAAREYNWQFPEKLYPLACEDRNFFDVVAMGVLMQNDPTYAGIQLFSVLGDPSQDPSQAVGLGGIRPGDKVALLGQACATLPGFTGYPTINPNTHQPPTYIQFHFTPGVRLFNTNEFDFGSSNYRSRVVAIMRPKVLHPESMRYANNPDVWHQYRGYVLAADSSGHYSLKLWLNKDNITADRLTVAPSNALSSVMILAGLGPKTVTSTTTFTGDPTALVLNATDTAGTDYSAWAGKEFEYWTTAPRPIVASSIKGTTVDAQQVSTLGLKTSTITVASLGAPAANIVAAANSGDPLSDTNDCYVVQAFSLAGLHGSASNETCAGPFAGRHYIVVNFTRVPGAAYYRLARGTTSGGTKHYVSDTDTNDNGSGTTQGQYDRGYGTLGATLDPSDNSTGGISGINLVHAASAPTSGAACSNPTGTVTLTIADDGSIATCGGGTQHVH